MCELSGWLDTGHLTRLVLDCDPSNAIGHSVLPCVNFVSRVSYSLTSRLARLARLFYRQRQHINRFLESNESAVSRTNHYRILALASIDILLTLPIGIASVVLVVTDQSSQGLLSFYSGWTYVHTDWEPESYPYSEVVSGGALNVAQQYFSQWTSPILGLAIFGLFGVTSEARASYWRIIYDVGAWFGWTSTSRAPLGEIEFSERPQDLESGCVIPSSREF